MLHRTSAAALLVALATTASAQEPAERRGAAQERVLVERVVVDAHVTGPDGAAIPGLGPADFVLRVDGKPVAIESVDWIASGTPEVDAATIAAVSPGDGSPAAAEYAPGRLIVFFFQTDHEASRLAGLLRMNIQARRFLEKLEPTDRVAVVSHDSKLNVLQDFTDDRSKLDRAIDAAIRRGAARAAEAEGGPSLARRVDADEARACASPEKALELVARALAPIPGGKSLLYFGWGLGTRGGLNGPNGSEAQAWDEAMLRMEEARTAIFVLDVTDADAHSLEGSIEQIADRTGGRYEKTHVFPVLAMDLVKSAIAGRYVIVFVKPKGPSGEHEIEIALASRPGRVSARQYYTD